MQITPDDAQPAAAVAPLDDMTPDVREANGPYAHLVKYCVDLYDRIKRSEYRASKLQEIKESYDAYEQKEQPTDDPWPGASNIVLPLTTISVDNLEPRIVSGLIGKRPYVKLEMESEQSQPEDVKLVEAWFNNELEETVNIERHGRDIAHALLLEGTVYPIAGYDTQERKIRDFATIQDAQQMPELAQGLQPTAIPLTMPNPVDGRPAPIMDPMTGQPKAQVHPPKYAVVGGVIVDGKSGQPVVIERAETGFEGGRIEYAEFNDLFILDDAEDWEATPVIRRVYPTYAELMRTAQGQQVGYIGKNIGPWLCREKTSGALGEDQASPRQDAADVQVSKEVIPCLECSISYVYRPTEDTEEKDVRDFTEERIVALIAEDKKILLRLCLLRDLNWKNEHLIKRIRMYPERGRAYGTTVAGKCKAIQVGASKTFNMAINIAEITLIPWFMFSSRLGMKGPLKLIPGMGMEVDDPSAVVFPKFSINPDQMFQYLSIWEGFHERLVSIGDLQVGRPADSKTTATEVMAVIEEGNVKHNYQVKTMRDEFISVFASIYDLYYQHMPLNKTFLYNGQQVPVPRAAMRRPVRFKLTGSTEFSNKLIERKENEDFFRFSRPDPIFNPITAAEDLCRSYGRSDVSRYINPQIGQVVKILQEVPEAGALFMQSVQQAQAQIQAAKGGAPGAPPPATGGPPA
jgi:hypothetical protein